MKQRHAPLWYFLYFPFEFLIESVLQKYWKWKPAKSENNNEIREENVAGKVVVITGANSGLGKCTAKEMAKRGAVVVMGCRDLQKGEVAKKEIINESGLASVELYHLDLSDLSSVRHFATEVLKNHPVIDILINNAGIYLNSNRQHLNKEGWELTMTTNYLGPFLLTSLLVSHILPSSIARVVTVSSTGCIGSMLDTDDIMMEKQTDMGFWGTMPYYNSKYASALFTKSLAKRYPSIKSYSVCSGYVKTEILRNAQGLTRMLTKLASCLLGLEVEQGVVTILLCSLGKQVGIKDSGGFFRIGKRVHHVENMLNDEVAKHVWDISEKLTNISYTGL